MREVSISSEGHSVYPWWVHRGYPENEAVIVYSKTAIDALLRGAEALRDKTGLKEIMVDAVPGFVEPMPDCFEGWISYFVMTKGYPLPD